MDYQAWKKKWIQYLGNRQVMTALLVAAVAGVVAFSVLFKSPVPGIMDYGEYTQTMYDMGLSYTARDSEKPEELTFTKVIERYEAEGLQPLKLLQVTPTQSLIYPVSLTILLGRLAGTNFHMVWMAFLLTAAAVCCIYSITRSLYFFVKEYAALFGFLLTGIVLCSSNSVYFNSLYGNGVFLLGLLFYFTVLLHIAAQGGRGGTKEIVKLFLASLFLLNARETVVFLLPVVAVSDIVMLLYSRPGKGRRLLHYGVGLVLLLLLVRTNVLFAVNSPSFLSESRLYNSFFTGVLTYTDEPDAILEELGLSEKLAADIGKNAYLPQADYMVAPGSDEAAVEIYSHIGNRELIETFVKHPDIYKNILDGTARSCITPDNGRFLYEGRRADEGTERVERFIWWQWVRQLLAPESAAGWAVYVFTAFCTVLACLIIFRKSREIRGLCAVMLTGIALAAFQFACVLPYYGLAEAGALNGYVMLPFDLMLAAGIGGAGLLLGKLSAFLAIGREEAEEEAEEAEESAEESEEVENTENAGNEERSPVCADTWAMNEPTPLQELFSYGWKRVKDGFARGVLDHPGRCAWCFGIGGALLLYWVLFSPPGIGAYNNGDFGRMMSAMNLQYTAQDWANQTELSLTKVVEKYDWVEKYDYTKVMPFHADLTQAWFSLPLKLLDNRVGLQFSTRYVAVMYAVILAFCFAVIMKVLFHRFGRRFLPVALLLLVVLFDLGNLGWLNSLFGEGIAFVGFMMVAACSLYVADRPRGSCRISLFVLLFSILLYCGSKAQFTVTAPLLLLWAGILFVYHSPAKRWRRAVYYVLFAAGCLWIGTSSVQIYQNNNEVSSPDAVYQSIFYGALMISGDPEATLSELGLDPALAADTGKNAFLDKNKYYCAPRTPEAEEKIYSKVSTTDVLWYYLKHPDMLWTVLDKTAQAGALTMPDYTLYVGEKTTEEHREVTRFNLWGNIRYLFAVDRFWGLVLFYGAELVICLWYLFNRRKAGKDKLLVGVFLLISAMGILQFPLTIIGNGFADNTKQLYIFRLTYDLTWIMGICLLYPVLRGGAARVRLWRKGRKKGKRKGERNDEA